MVSTRPISLNEWGISWEEYKELSYFCLQYEQKKREAAALLTIRSATPTPVMYHKNGIEYGAFLPHSSGQISDPVAVTASRRDKLLGDVHMIEQAAMTAGRLSDGCSIYSALLRAVTTRSGVQAVFANPNTRPPCGERQFYNARRKFFWVLREMKNGQ